MPDVRRLRAYELKITGKTAPERTNCSGLPSIEAAAGAAQAPYEHGWTPPSWAELTQEIHTNPAGTSRKWSSTICKEAGTQVTTNTRLADLNMYNLPRADDCRIEVKANGLLTSGKFCQR